MESPEQEGFIRVCDLDKLKEGVGRAAYVGTLKIALFRIGDEIYALKNACPHAGASLSMGAVEGCVVTCPRHDWRFNLRTGACLTNRIFGATTYPVRLHEGGVWVYV